MNRIALLKSELDLSHAGLEIGVLHNPCVSRAESDVRYVDHLPTDLLKEKYKAQSFPHWQDIHEVDIVVGPEGLRAAVGESRFGYVIASHVIEHIHNPIAWLRDIHGLLEDGGVLALAIPDKRYCFDALRTETSTGQWIDAYVRNEPAPTPGQIFDALHNEVVLNGSITWDGDVPSGLLKRLKHPSVALHTARDTFAARAYYDVHCSVFTPASFFLVLRQLAVLGLFDFEVAGFVDSIGHEFFVHLRRPGNAEWTKQISSIPLVREGRFASIPKSFDAAFYLRTHPDVAAAHIDPAEHFLNYGRDEKRAYSA